MTIQVNYLENGIGIEVIASEIVTGEEVIEAHKEIYNDENFIKKIYKIVDRTDCTKYQVYPEDIEKIAEMDDEASRINPNLIIAVISTTSLQHGMTRMWQAHMKNNVFIARNFLDRLSADNWINSYIETN
jgi:dihydroxyacetone kinase-like predicted kinase